ncbi:hypothetical protein jhhlp_002577 [Lomentospora prolificans]|uniref:Golgi to ER traffic protein 4 n=1 Tax=Lomentospora prolificans TaxID=41688 RepID=A0A2N3NED7_9PEZI|nr:hypothetical protein jhhlp_002577 [Lomentospora prolificans]
MSANIQKTVARLQEKIEEGQFYEAQQQTRVVAARYIKAKKWDAAIDILFNVAKALLTAGQGGSGGDLCNLLVEVYEKAELAPDANSKGRLLTCLRLFDSEEPTRKKFIGSMIGWSSKFGEFPAGDPELHHVVGSLYAEEHESYDAERHLVLGTKDSPEILARMEYKWYKEGDSHLAAQYVARAVIPYLLVGNVRAANTSFRIFTSALCEDNKGLSVQDVSSQSSDSKIFPSLPLLNFLSLLLLAVQRGSADLYRQLITKYSAHLKENGTWFDSLDAIAEMYFGVKRQRQSNPLFDMMGSLFGGGGASSQPARRPAANRVEAPAPEGLD